MNKKIVELLYRSFDTELTAEEQRQLDEALSGSKNLRDEKERIVEMRNTLSDGAAESFSPFFAERLMQQVRAMDETGAGLEPFFQSLYRLFKPLAVVATAAILTLIAINLQRSDEITVAAAFAVQDDKIEILLETPLESILKE
jgi:hypothetical protein